MGIFNNLNSYTNEDLFEYIKNITQQFQAGIALKMDANGDHDFENKKLANVHLGDNNNDVMVKSQIEGYVTNKTDLLNGSLPAKVTPNKTVIYSNSGSVHSNGLYLKDRFFTRGDLSY